MISDEIRKALLEEAAESNFFVKGTAECPSCGGRESVFSQLRVFDLDGSRFLGYGEVGVQYPCKVIQTCLCCGKESFATDHLFVYEVAGDGVGSVRRA